MPTLRTLFSGGELFGVGAQQAGYTHADGYELDPKIAAVAQLNGFDVRVADVCAVDYAALPTVNHLHASPSCKNASNANQKGVDENGDPLPRETEQDLACADAVCRAIAAHQGETFTLENVYGYRTFQSFDRIREALRAADFSYEYWHLTAADYGVPQTRKRLILIARRELCRIQRPNPTHRDGGDMFHPPWIGWYAAIEDILHTLPPTQPSPWQLARLPKEIRDSMLLSGAMSNGTSVVMRDSEAPAVTVVAADELKLPMRAFLVQSKNVSQEWGDGTRKVAAAYLLDGENAPTWEPWECDEQLDYEERMSRPVPQVTGRWVRMTVQALGRFQTVPDDYRGLTAEINGNGVPCELARQIMLSVKG